MAVSNPRVWMFHCRTGKYGLIVHALQRHLLDSEIRIRAGEPRKSGLIPHPRCCGTPNSPAPSMTTEDRKVILGEAMHAGPLMIDGIVQTEKAKRLPPFS